MIISSKTENFENIDFAEGTIVLIDKPLTWTSFDVVNKIRITLKKKLNISKIKVGHAGTLDPLATGLVIIATGKFTKQIDLYQAETKEYIADITFGKSTPSFDSETEPNAVFETKHITFQSIANILKLNLSGEIQQVPPIYSAKQKDGVRAYDMARKGQEIIMDSRTVTIYKSEIVSFDNPCLKLKIECSKGTYIRSIAHDLGKLLESGAFLSGLQRTRSGDFTIEDCISLSEFEAKFNMN